MRTVSQAGERLLLGPVVAGELPAVARRELERRELRLKLPVHGAHVAIVKRGGHGEDGLLILTPELVGAADNLDRRELAQRDEADPRRRGRSPTRQALEGAAVARLTGSWPRFSRSYRTWSG